MRPSNRALKNLSACARRAAERGLPDMFDNHLVVLERKYLDYTREIAEYTNEHGQYPNVSIPLGKRLIKMRMAKGSKNGRGVKNLSWFDSCDELAAELGYPAMFNFIDREKIALDRTKETSEFYHEHGHYPKNKDGTLGRWLSKMRHTYSNPKESKNMWYPSCLTLAIELGCPDMFEQTETIDLLEKRSLEYTQEIIDYHKEHGRYPPGGKTSLGNWLVRQRQARAGKSQSRVRFYPSCEELAKKHGLLDMFEVKGSPDALKRKALENTRKVAAFYHKHGRYPTIRANRELGGWLGNIRRSRLGRNSAVWYPECQTLAEELGCPTMFVIDKRRGGTGKGVFLTKEEIAANEKLAIS